MNPYDFQEYRIIREKTLSNKLYRLFIILFLIGMIFLIFKFDFNVYEKYILIKEDNNYNLIASIEDIDYITKSKFIYIDNKKYSYKIGKISNKYENINGTLFRNITILIDDYKMVDDYSYCFFLRKSDTFLNMMIKFIRGGFYG